MIKEDFMWEIDCIKCEHEFDAKVWDSGKCPKCGTEFYWDSIWCEEINEDWIFPVFEVKE